MKMLMTMRIPRGAAAFAVLAACGTATIATAQSARRPMTFSDVMALRSLGSVDLSPDGRSVVYSVSEYNLKDTTGTTEPRRIGHLWLVSSDGGTPRQLTFGERGESNAQWSPDGKAIAFTAARGTEKENQKSQIWLLPLSAGGEARQLTHAHDGAGGYSWSPDGSKIAYLSVDSLSTAETRKRARHDDADVYESNFRFTHLWVTDVATGKTTELAHGNYTLSALAIIGVPQWSPDGTRIAFVAAPTTMLRDLRGAIYVATVATGNVERVATEYRAGASGLIQPMWSPDGATLAFVNAPPSKEVLPDSIPGQMFGNGELILYDVSSGKSRTILPTSIDVVLGPLQWTPDGKSLLFTSSDHAQESVFRYDVASGQFSRVTSGMMVGGFSMSRDGSRVAFSMDTPTSPSDVYVTDLTFRSPKKITNINPQVANFELGQTEVIKWKSTDGLTIEGVLLKPVGYQPGKTYPLVVEVHGGPTGANTNGFKGSSGSPGQVWAGKGWAVLYPNPRGSTGYGEKFMAANLNDWGTGPFSDIMAGVNDVIRLGVADSSRMALMGWSYGGYMAAWTVGHTSRFKAVRMGAGVSNLMSMYGTSEIPGYIGMFEGGMPSAKTLPLYHSMSPITYADRATTPLLILHGADDPRVPPGQALEFYRALKDRGKTVELVLYPREQHGFGEYYHLVDRMKRDYAWISRYTLGTESGQE